MATRDAKHAEPDAACSAAALIRNSLVCYRMTVPAVWIPDTTVFSQSRP